jgi:hypothetical protein
MERKPAKTAEHPTPRRAPYRRPTLRAYGSIQSITQARQVSSTKYDGAGGGGKTRISG